MTTQVINPRAAASIPAPLEQRRERARVEHDGDRGNLAKASKRAFGIAPGAYRGLADAVPGLEATAPRG